MAEVTVAQRSARDSYDALTKKLAQLEAMLTLSYGESLKSIDDMNESLREHFYWACADMAKDCGDLLALIPYPTYRNPLNTDAIYFNPEPEDYSEGQLTGTRLAITLLEDVRNGQAGFIEISRALSAAKSEFETIGCFTKPTKSGAASTFIGVVIESFIAAAKHTSLLEVKRQTLSQQEQASVSVQGVSA